MSWLVGYEAPKSSNNYMKLQDGENRFRVLSLPVFGYEDWIDNKPVRYSMENKPAKPHDPKKPIKHFWAFMVWNYLEEKVQIAQITQRSVQNAIMALQSNEDWGDPYHYDIKVHKKGEGINTEYNVTPVPHKPLPAHVKDAFNEKSCNLVALFDNADPFASGYDSYTKGIFSKDDKVVCISSAQKEELENMLSRCDDKYKAQVSKVITDQFKAPSIEKLPIEHFERVRNAIQKKVSGA